MRDDERRALGSFNRRLLIEAPQENGRSATRAGSQRFWTGLTLSLALDIDLTTFDRQYVLAPGHDLRPVPTRGRDGQ